MATDTDDDSGRDDAYEDDYVSVELVTTTADVGVADHTEGLIPTVLDRLLRAGIDPERAERLLSSGAVLVDGVRVTDPDTPAEPPARIVLLPA